MLAAGFFERCDDVSDFGAANVFHVQHFEPVLRRHNISHQNVPAPAAALGNHLERFFAEDIGRGNDAGHVAVFVSRQQQAHAALDHAPVRLVNAIGGTDQHRAYLLEVGHHDIRVSV